MKVSLRSNTEKYAIRAVIANEQTSRDLPQRLNSGRLSAPLSFTYEVDQIRIDRSPISLRAEGILKLRNFLHAAADFSPLKNARRSALIWSALVVGIPCGKPGYTFSVAFFTIFADIRPAAPIGTI